jgi:6-phosphofructokinase 1
MAIRNLGIITSGGDCGGLNAVIKGATMAALRCGLNCYVIPNGYAGLYNLVEMDSLVRLSEERIESVNIVLAGSEAGHSRVSVQKIKDPGKYQRIRAGLEKFAIDALIISGGDDTGSVMVDLSEQGIPCVHAPKTMDLDLNPYSVGGDSAINRIASFVSALKTTGRTHNRIMVVEVFGRYSGHTAFRGGVAADADCILIPEIPVDFDVVYGDIKRRYFRRVLESDIRAGTYTIVVAEGIKTASGEELVDESAGVDAFGHKRLAGAGKYVSQEITKRLKADPDRERFMRQAGMFVEGLYEVPEVREVRPSHLVRSGFTSAYDVNFGLEIGAGAVLLALQGVFGVTVVKVEGKEICYQPTAEAIAERQVDLDEVAFYENLGFCFGRDPATHPCQPVLREVKGRVSRIY